MKFVLFSMIITLGQMAFSQGNQTLLQNLPAGSEIRIKRKILVPAFSRTSKLIGFTDAVECRLMPDREWRVARLVNQLKRFTVTRSRETSNGQSRVEVYTRFGDQNYVEFAILCDKEGDARYDSTVTVGDVNSMLQIVQPGPVM